MFSKQTLLAYISLASTLGLVNAFNGTAYLGFANVEGCSCPAFNGPYGVAVPRALVGSHTCCNEGVTLSYKGNSVTAVFSGFFDAEGAQDVALSPRAFSDLAPSTWTGPVEGVVWQFA
ncbi:hypothetical protein MIND_01405300 [Mycena indigotica]|uniref:Uncharacterized protein n=1 Tax=Mycena indigotica TaxID=2126181 RepID=A0A8H6RYA1_9AGAR|nr:uncharacterized protein MIND_01405300 [Mycena indigotica]KAF7288893.1 hypothetical protein MIND_01405300 [Mycena indigotica]